MGGSEAIYMVFVRSQVEDFHTGDLAMTVRLPMDSVIHDNLGCLHHNEQQR